MSGKQFPSHYTKPNNMDMPAAVFMILLSHVVFSDVYSIEDI